jgi:hypothetical protein
MDEEGLEGGEIYGDGRGRRRKKLDGEEGDQSAEDWGLVLFSWSLPGLGRHWPCLSGRMGFS